jgi:hypothetical protein
MACGNGSIGSQQHRRKRGRSDVHTKDCLLRRADFVHNSIRNYSCFGASAQTGGRPRPRPIYQLKPSFSVTLPDQSVDAELPAPLLVKKLRENVEHRPVAAHRGVGKPLHHQPLQMLPHRLRRGLRGKCDAGG